MIRGGAPSKPTLANLPQPAEMFARSSKYFTPPAEFFAANTSYYISR